MGIPPLTQGRVAKAVFSRSRMNPLILASLSASVASVAVSQVSQNAKNLATLYAGRLRNLFDEETKSDPETPALLWVWKSVARLTLIFSLLATH
jgi:hypothetical protein